MRKKKDRFWPYVVKSTLAHILVAAAFLLALAGGGSQGQNKINRDDAVSVILPKPTEGTKTSLPEQKDQMTDNTLRKIVPHLNDKCVKFFGGIGVTWNAVDNGEEFVKITYVGHGYPADLVGMKVGDVLLNHAEMRGQIGTPVTIRFVDAMGTVKVVQTFRDKICEE